jgi:hypothetical protein
MRLHGRNASRLQRSGLLHQAHNNIIKNKMNFLKAIFMLICAAISLLIWSPSLQAQDFEQENIIYEELAEQRRMMTGEIITVYGVPCVEVMLEPNESIREFVNSIPSLRKNLFLIRKGLLSLIKPTTC